VNERHQHNGHVRANNQSDTQVRRMLARTSKSLNCLDPGQPGHGAHQAKFHVASTKRDKLTRGYCCHKIEQWIQKQKEGYESLIIVPSEGLRQFTESSTESGDDAQANIAIQMDNKLTSSLLKKTTQTKGRWGGRAKEVANREMLRDSVLGKYMGTVHSNKGRGKRAQQTKLDIEP